MIDLKPPACRHPPNQCCSFCAAHEAATAATVPFDPETMRIGAGGMVVANAADPFNHPPHYQLGGVEVIDAIEAWQLGFCLGNAVKYIARAGKKDPALTVEDLKKARWYLERQIAALEKP